MHAPKYRDKQEFGSLRALEVERDNESGKPHLLAIEVADHRCRSDRYLIGVEQLHRPKAVVGEVLQVVAHHRLDLGERVPAIGHEVLPFEIAHLALRCRRRADRRQRKGDGERRRRRCQGAEYLPSSYEHVHVLIERPSASDSR